MKTKHLTEDNMKQYQELIEGLAEPNKCTEINHKICCECMPEHKYNPILKCHIEERIKRMYGINTECGIDHLMQKLEKLNRLWLRLGFTKSLQEILSEGVELRCTHCNKHRELLEDMSDCCNKRCIAKQLNPEASALLDFILELKLK